MVILYLVFLFPLTIGAYHKAGYGQFCSDTSTRIRNRYDCQVAAAALGLTWGKSWWGPWDFPGCLHTRDSRNKVYFNESPHPTNDPTSHPKMANYAEICTGEDPADKHFGFVITGGDNPNRVASSEMISSMGVCVSPNTNIPDLPTAFQDGIAGAKSIWIEASTTSDSTLMFCGGSDTFLGHKQQYPNGWGAMNTCLKVKPGEDVWDSNPNYNMKVPRGWFSMNNMKMNEAVASGGMTTGFGNILDSIEKYSNGHWEYLMNGNGDPIKLAKATYGHCAVQYDIGGEPYLMTIAGSNNPTSFSDATNEVTVYNLATGIVIPREPGDLPALWAPACTKIGEDIFVTGGWISVTASTEVYQGTVNGLFKKIGSLIKERSGHTMGATSKGNLFVAGGYDPRESGTYLKEIETSTDGGKTWKPMTMELATGGEYAAIAQVPAFTFTCP